jgi:DHA1 family tetracycline resistance protein-like MFS transporter
MDNPLFPRTGGRSAASVFIFVTVLLDALALGIVIPVLPKLVESFVEGNTARAATIFGLFGTVWALMQFVFSPVLGGLSDKFGRRRVILISCFGLGIDYAFMALAPSVGWLFVGRVISGITAASFSTAMAYISDITPAEKRAAAFGIVGAGWGSGFVLGPAVGGILGNADPRLPFWIASGLALLNATYGVFVLPESLPVERRKEFSWKRANPLGSLRLLRSNRALLGLASVNTIYYLSHHALSSVFVLYGGYRYGWTPRMVGITLAIVGVFNIIVQGALVRPLVARFRERRMLLTGLFMGAIGFAMFGLAPTEQLLWAGIPVFAFMGLFSPSAQGLMTRLVSPSEQGLLQGTNTSLMGLTGIIGPALFTQVFAYFIGPGKDMQLPGAPFFLATALMFGGMIVAWSATHHRNDLPSA